MINWLRFRITLQTIKDNGKITFILTLLFMIMAIMYAGMFPSIKETLIQMVEGGMAETYQMLPGASEMDTYVGFLNMELYQIFWLLILAIMLGFIAASSISKEIEGKTIDILMSNPISRKQIIFEKFMGLIPTVLIITFATYGSIVLITIAIEEELNFNYLLLTHIASIPYLLTVVAIGILISVIINEKMKASIIMIAIIVGMFVFQSISLMAPDFENMGYLSITHYFNPYDILKNGDVDMVGIIVLFVIMAQCLIFAMLYFEHKDINVS